MAVITNHAGLGMAALLIAFAIPAGAQEDTSSKPKQATVPADLPKEEEIKLEEVVVTATKRAKTERDIPGSVSAIKGADLEAIHAQSLADYLKRTPGVVLVDNGAADRVQPIIRGIAASTSDFGGQFTQLPTGIYVDDMPFTDLYTPFSTPDLNPFDLERVEILKGPQGTLFGSGALAGAIRYILQKPLLAQWETKFNETIVSDSKSDGLSPVSSAALNVPIGDTAALRAVGVLRRTTGRLDDRTTGEKDTDNVGQNTERLLGRWNITSRLNAGLLYFRQQTTQHNSPSADNPYDFDNRHEGMLFRRTGFSGANLSVSYDFDDFALLSSSNFRTKSVINQALGGAAVANPAGNPNGDGGNGQGVDTEDTGQHPIVEILNSRTKGMFQEFRLSSPEGHSQMPFDWLAIDWLGGIAFQKDWQSFDQREDAAAALQVLGPLDGLAIFPLDTPVGGIYGASNTVSVLNASLTSAAQEAAIFGETTMRFVDHIELTLGGRLFDTREKVYGFLEGAEVTAFNGNFRFNDEGTLRAHGFNPRASLRYIFNRNFSVYALASKGFQFGGFQLNPAFTVFANSQAGPSFKPFKSSKLWNYEAGFRSDWFNGRVRWDTTFFFLDWKDLQLTVSAPLVPEGDQAGLTVGIIENVGAAQSKGVETGLTFQIARGLSWSTNAAWINAIVTEQFTDINGTVEPGTRLPASSRFQLANIVTYTQPLPYFESWASAINLTHAYLGPSYNDLQYSRRQGGYDTLDATFSIVEQRSRFKPEISVGLRNMMDARGIAAVSHVTSGSANVNYSFIPPRMAVFSVGFKY